MRRKPQLQQQIIETDVVHFSSAKKAESTVVTFRSRGLMAVVSGSFVYSIIVASFDGVLERFVKESFDFNSTVVSLIFLAVNVPALFGTLFGALADHYGPRSGALAMYAIATLGLALLVLITQRARHRS